MNNVHISNIMPEIEDLTLRSIRQALTAYKSGFYLDDLSITQLSFLVDKYGIDTINKRIRTRQVDFNKMSKLISNYNTKHNNNKKGEIYMLNNLTKKELEELLESGETHTIKELEDGTEYVLETQGDSFAAVKRQWAPDDPKSWENWVVLAYISEISIEGVDLQYIVDELDDYHNESVEEEKYWEALEQAKLKEEHQKELKAKEEYYKYLDTLA